MIKPRPESVSEVIAISVAGRGTNAGGDALCSRKKEEKLGRALLSPEKMHGEEEEEERGKRERGGDDRDFNSRGPSRVGSASLPSSDGRKEGEKSI